MKNSENNGNYIYKNVGMFEWDGILTTYSRLYKTFLCYK